MDLFGHKRRIAQLEESLATQQRLFDIQQIGWTGMEDRYRILATDVKVIQRAIGKIIAKLDPNYHVDELDKDRKAASDKLGDQVIARLKGEYAASNPTGS